jgi:TorA maturation chaperone TorD
MDEKKITTLSPLFLRFYARCFAYPYSEQQYELQHLFREMENEPVSDEESEHLEIILSIINEYQGQDIKVLREDFVITFTNTLSNQTPCPLLASEFIALFHLHYDPDSVQELFYENGITTEGEESFDSIINYLDYLSLLYDQFLSTEIESVVIEEFVNRHVLNWIPLFCQQVEKRSSLTLYKEVAQGLRLFLLWSGT